MTFCKSRAMGGTMQNHSVVSESAKRHRGRGPGPGRQRAEGGRPPAGVALPPPVLAVRGPRRRAAESGQEPSRLFIPLPCDWGSVPALSHFFHSFQLKAQASILLGSPRRGYGMRVLLQGQFPCSCPRALRAPAAASVQAGHL